jgi:perosamine synthetase
MAERLAILGGQPIRTIPFLNRKTMGTNEIEAATRVINSEILSGFLAAPGSFFNGGKEVKAFEKSWAEKYGFKHAISVNSWTSGLMVAVGAVGIKPGDEVICSPYSMSASATAALFYGGIPVFADLDPETFCLDPKSIEEKITSKTKAIIVVHLFGGPADMDSIMKIAKPRGIKVIEDCAQAPGVFYKNKAIGAIGDIGGFSFNFHKHIHCGEGGLLVTNDDELAFRAQLIRNHGENCFDLSKLSDLGNVIGGNYRLTEIQAAIAFEQLKKLDDILERRQTLAKYLNERLSKINGISVKEVEEGSTHAYYMYPFRFHEDIFGISRNLFLRAVSAELPKPSNWETTPLAEGYVKPLYLNDIYQQKIAIGTKGFPFNVNKEVNYDYSKGICPVTEKLYYQEMLYSPLVREPLSIEDMKDFVDAIEKVINNIDQLKNSDLNNGTDEIHDAVKAVEDVGTTK